MINKRVSYIYHLVGVINKKTLHKSPPESKYAGRRFYKIHVTIHESPQIRRIQVFPDKLQNSDIWADLENEQCFGKTYVLDCQNYFGNYFLINWKELEKQRS